MRRLHQHRCQGIGRIAARLLGGAKRGPSGATSLDKTWYCHGCGIGASERHPLRDAKGATTGTPACGSCGKPMVTDIQLKHRGHRIGADTGRQDPPDNSPPTPSGLDKRELDAIYRSKQAIEQGKGGDEDWEECGVCGGWHPADWFGDCRDDEMRLPSHPEDVLGSATAEELAAVESGWTPTPRLRPPRPDWYGAFGREGPPKPDGAAGGIGRIAAGLLRGSGRATARAASLAADDILQMVYRALRAGSDAGGFHGVEIGTGADGQEQISLTTAWASGPGYEGGRQTWILDAESILEADSGSDAEEGPAPREPGL